MSTNQFDLDFSGRLPVSAQIGMKQAEDNCDAEWLHIFDACVLAAAKKKAFVTSDDVVFEMEQLRKHPSTHNFSAIGPAMVRGIKAKILEPTDQHRRSERPGKHGNLQRVYRSLYWTPF